MAKVFNVTILAQIPSGIWVLGFVSMLMDISSEMIHSLLPMFMVTILGTSVLTVGIIEGLAEATALIIKVFSGILSDYLGKKKEIVLFGYSLSALTKPLFALATSISWVFAARILDRLGKGIRGAPRDALVADLAPKNLLGASFGLRQSLDTLGAVLGPILAFSFMMIFVGNFRAVFALAIIPGIIAVVLIVFGVRESQEPSNFKPINPLLFKNLKLLSRSYWWVCTIGTIITLARFSEAFLVLRAMQGGISLTLVPLFLAIMNIMYACSAYPFGKLADKMSHTKLLILGLIALSLADLILASSAHWSYLLTGVCLWGLHMGLTQGLLAAMVADSAPSNLRGTAYGFFNLLSGLGMLLASTVAGFVWEKISSSGTFYLGALFCFVAILGLALWKKPEAINFDL
jgi:MFS family permease